MILGKEICLGDFSANNFCKNIILKHQMALIICKLRSNFVLNRTLIHISFSFCKMHLDVILVTRLKAHYLNEIAS